MSIVLSILGFCFGFWLGILIHEAGHFVCARAAGLGIRFVRVAAGPLLGRGRYGVIPFELRLLPWGGITAATLASSFHRGRQAFFVLGGILANIAFLLLLGLLDARLVPASALHRALIPIAIAQYWLIVNSMLPYQVTVDGERRLSDGLSLFYLWLFPLGARLYLKNKLSFYQAQPTAFPGAKALASRLTYLHANARNWASPADRLKSIEALESELQRTGLPQGEELLVLDVLITWGLTADDPSPLHGKLDRWSQRALELGSSLATIRGSRGSVLALLGRYQEAKALLTTVPTSANAPLMDVIMTKIFLAQALSALGEQSEAQRLIAEARAAAPAKEPVPGPLRLLARVEAEIGK